MRFSISALLILTAILALIAAMATKQSFLFLVAQTAAWMSVAGQAFEASLGRRQWLLTFLSLLSAAGYFFLSLKVIGFSPAALVVGCILGVLVGWRNTLVRSRRGLVQP
jgi:hypothetical protein